MGATEGCTTEQEQCSSARIGIPALCCEVRKTCRNRQIGLLLVRRLTSREISQTPETIMKGDLIRSTAAFFVVVLASLGVPLAAQDKPDFSGSWILESGSPGADIPQALSVSQSVVRTN